MNAPVQATALGSSRYSDPSRVQAYAEQLLGPRRAPHPGWEDDAACVGDERFYDRDTVTADVIAHQRRVCGACTVAADCLLDALAHERVSLAWQVSTRGGLLARERRHLTKSGTLAAEDPTVGRPGQGGGLCTSSIESNRRC